MDILRELNGSTRYTLHSHTQFCDGHAPMEQFVTAAIDAGFTHYGFTPHSPIPIASPCNMKQADVELYIAEYHRLNNTYGNQIKLYAAMEIDFLGKHWGATNDYFKGLPLHYLISSVHFIPAQDGTFVDIDGRLPQFVDKMNNNFHRDIRYVVDTFFAQTQSMLEYGGFEIIGHFDKIGHNASGFAPGIEDTLWYRQHVNDLIDTIIAKGVVVEINTKAYAEHGRFFPGTSVWQRLKENHVPLIVNSDAHYPERIDSSRNIAYELLNSL